MAGGAHLILVRDGHLGSGAHGDTAERAEAFLSGQGTASEQVLWMKKSLRYEEDVLEPGEEVPVLGVANWENADGGERLILAPTSEHTLTISDDPSTL